MLRRLAQHPPSRLRTPEERDARFARMRDAYRNGDSQPVTVTLGWLRTSVIVCLGAISFACLAFGTVYLVANLEFGDDDSDDDSPSLNANVLQLRADLKEQESESLLMESKLKEATAIMASQRERIQSLEVRLGDAQDRVSAMRVEVLESARSASSAESLRRQVEQLSAEIDEVKAEHEADIGYWQRQAHRARAQLADYAVSLVWATPGCTGSMEPAIRCGDEVLLERRVSLGRAGAEMFNVCDLKVGDIVTFSATYHTSLILHRIVARDDSNAPDCRFETKGDANAYADPGLIGAESIRERAPIIRRDGEFVWARMES